MTTRVSAPGSATMNGLFVQSNMYARSCKVFDATHTHKELEPNPKEWTQAEDHESYADSQAATSFYLDGVLLRGFEGASLTSQLFHICSHVSKFVPGAFSQQ